MYFVNIPRLVELLCYIRDATNASAEWVFAKRVKLAGKDFVTRAYRRWKICLHCKVLIETRPTPVSPLIFVELCILQTPSVSQRTSTIRNCSDNCWVVVDAELFEDSCDQASGDLLGYKVSLASPFIDQSRTTSGDIECCLKEQNRKGAYRPSTLPNVEPLSILESNRIVQVAQHLDVVSRHNHFTAIFDFLWPM